MTQEQDIRATNNLQHDVVVYKHIEYIEKKKCHRFIYVIM